MSVTTASGDRLYPNDSHPVSRLARDFLSNVPKEHLAAMHKGMRNAIGLPDAEAFSPDELGVVKRLDYGMETLLGYGADALADVDALGLAWYVRDMYALGRQEVEQLVEAIEAGQTEANEATKQ